MLASCAPPLREVRPRLRACGGPALRRLPPSRRRAAQAVDQWCTADGCQAFLGFALALLQQGRTCVLRSWTHAFKGVGQQDGHRFRGALQAVSFAHT